MNNNIIAAVILGISLLGTGYISSLGGETIISSSQSAFSTIHVSSEGKAIAIPDTIIIRAGAQINGVETQEIAYAQMNQTINAIKEILTRNEIDEPKIQTENLSVNQSFNYRDGEQTPNGFDAYQTLTIRLENKGEETANTILDTIAIIPNIQINGVDFETLSTDGVYSEARKQAILKAQTKAQEIADASGVKLGKILSISESTSQNYTPIYSMAKSESMDALGGGVNISSGELEYSVSVDVTYEMK